MGLTSLFLRRRPITYPAGMIVEDVIQVRISGGPELPTLIYVPGLHGDWTLVGSFRKAVKGRVRFVEMTYPRTLTWSLDDYARSIAKALCREGIPAGWLLGESFGSQVVWALIREGRFDCTGIIMAGGFVKHPARWGVQMAVRLCGSIPLRAITTILFGYGRMARFRFRKAPDVAAGINEFIARRTELDRHAAVHRLRLILHNDFTLVAATTQKPVYCISGLLDPVVPWWFVRRWLRSHCPALRDYRVIPGADHNVLGTAPKAASDLIVNWMRRGL